MRLRNFGALNLISSIYLVDIKRWVRVFGTQKLFVIMTMQKHPPNQHISLGLHPKLLELIDIASRNELKNRSFFIREALVDALINRGAIVGLEQNDEIQDALISLCGSQL